MVLVWEVLGGKSFYHGAYHSSNYFLETLSENYTTAGQKMLRCGRRIMIVLEPLGGKL